MSEVRDIFFESGGTLPPNAPSYVERAADLEIRQRLSSGQFCYVLTSRQMGKSSLMSRTASELRRRGVQPLILDLTAVGQNLTTEQWYGGLVAHMGRKLGLEDELENYWLNNGHMSPVQRFFAGIRILLLPALAARNPAEPPPKLVIFIDEIDVVRSLPFTTDEFFGAIRECYNRRIEDAEFNRVTFCLLGVATPAELMRDPRLTPFNIGQRIELRDFTLASAQGLAAGFKLAAEQSAAVLDRVFHWTGGHPYLTQRLCQALARRPGSVTALEVDAECEELFLSNRARERDDNLLFVRERLLRSEGNLTELLKLYARILAGEQIADDESSTLVTSLHLAGIVKAEGNFLCQRNRIYSLVFNPEWIKVNMPAPRNVSPGSIAVLPFAARGPGRRNDYLSDGVTEELINSLGQVSALKVASRTSAYQFKGRNEDVRRIGAQLNVRFVLEGSVFHEVSDAFRISAELVSADDGYCVWSDNFGEMQLSELGVALDQITTSIVTRLKREVGLAAHPPAARRRSRSQAAYNAYLKGRHYWNRRSEDSVKKSIQIFQEALAEDPEFALAHAALADAYIIMGAYSFAPPLDVVPKAAECAVRALELDDHLAQAHCAMAWTLCVHDWNWERAEEEFLRAIELNPSYATARQWYAINCLTPLGRHEDSLSQLWQALDVDPLSISINASLGLALHMAGRFEDALAHFQQTLEMDAHFSPTYLFMGWTLEQLGRYDEARTAFDRAYELGGHNPVALASLAHLCGLSKQRDEAQSILARLREISTAHYVPCTEVALVYAGLGDHDLAFERLRQALVEKPLRLVYLAVDPRSAELRKDPRCSSLLQKIGLGGSIT